MPKSNPSRPTQNIIPTAPWIYINDPSSSHHHASKLTALIPEAVHFRLSQTLCESADFLQSIRHSLYHDTIVVISDDKNDHEESSKQVSAQILKEASIKHGCNFASINLYNENASVQLSKWGTNHLELAISAPNQQEILSSDSCAETIYKWLFSVFTVPEQLHLIPDSQMQETDRSSLFESYEYCPINQSRTRPKNAKIQFVALILTKPEIGPDRRISWQVIDKSGIANFYFQYRGPSSQFTWDWVLSLKPGQRKCLPRMPSVQIHERKITTVVKAPFRISAAVIGGTGHMIKGVGKGLCKMGSKIKLGDRSQWVPEADVVIDLRSGRTKLTKIPSDDKYAKVMPTTNKTEVQVFSEKGEKMWRDNDSVASTTAGSIVDEKVAADFI